jgi:hypothetical protein
VVKGLDLFRRHFADRADQYVLIGGTAATLAEDLNRFLDGLAADRSFDPHSLRIAITIEVTSERIAVTYGLTR